MTRGYTTISRSNCGGSRRPGVLSLAGCLAALLLLSHPAFAATKYWVGGTGNWNQTAHWSLASGGAGGAAVPGVADVAVFDSLSDVGEAAFTCTLNVAVSVLGVNVGTSLVTITQGVVGVRVGASNYIQSAGTFNGSGSAITINGAFALNGGTFKATSSTLNMNGNFTLGAGGAFNHNSGLFRVNAASCAITGSPTFFNVTIIAGFTLTAPALPDTITIAGTSLTVGGAFAPNGGTVIFSGANTTTISGAAATKDFCNVTINAGKTLAAQPGGTIRIAGNFQNNGAFTRSTGTVVFNGATTISGASLTTFYKVTINNASTLTAKLNDQTGIASDIQNNGTFNANGGTIVFAGTSTILGGTSTTTFNNVTINATRTLSFPAVTVNVAGNWVKNGTFNNGGGTVVFTGATTVSGASATTFNHVSITGTLTAPAGNLNVQQRRRNGHLHRRGRVDHLRRHHLPEPALHDRRQAAQLHRRDHPEDKRDHDAQRSGRQPHRAPLDGPGLGLVSQLPERLSDRQLRGRPGLRRLGDGDQLRIRRRQHGLPPERQLDLQLQPLLGGRRRELERSDALGHGFGRPGYRPRPGSHQHRLLRRQLRRRGLHRQRPGSGL